MKKKIIALLMATLLFVSVTPVVGADDSLISPHGSDYLDSCIITETPMGNRQIRINYVVYGTDEMTELGATKIEIERYDDYEEDWVYDRTLAGGSTTNDVSHAATAYFYGTRGERYRAVIFAYAKMGSGGDSREYPGTGVYCK